MAHEPSRHPGERESIDASQVMYTAPDAPNAAPTSVHTKLAERLSVMDFGARGGGDNCRDAFQACADACRDRQRTMYVPKVEGDYHIEGSGMQMPPYVEFELGARIQWNPGGNVNQFGTPVLADGTTWDLSRDLEACLEFPHPGSLCINADVQAQVHYSMENLVSNGFVVLRGAGLLADMTEVDLDLSDPAHYPDYRKFLAPGFTAFKTVGGGKVKFVRPTCSGVKFGLTLDSTDGHVTWLDNEMRGLFVVYCKKNSEDYLAEGGGTSGVLGGYLIGDEDWAGHNGGMALSAIRHHFGYVAYVVLQVHNNYPDDGRPGIVGQSGGLYGQHFGCSWEQVGEAAIKTFAGALSNLQFGRAGDGGWSSNPQFELPNDMLSPEKKRRYLFWFGKLGFLKSENEWPFVSSNHDDPSRKVAWIGELTRGFTQSHATLDVLGGSAMVDLDDKYPGAYGAEIRSFVGATKGDLKLMQQVRPRANLIENPEVPDNWRAYTPGSAIAVTSARALLESGEVPPDFFPKNFFSELGDDPVVVKMTPADGSDQFTFQIGFRHAPLVVDRRDLVYSLWHGYRGSAGQSCGSTVMPYDSANRGYYGTSVFIDAGRMEKREALGKTPGPDGLTLLSVDASATMYLAGLMVSYDDVTVYNPHGSPSIDLASFPTRPDALQPGALWLNNGVLTAVM